MAQGHWPGETEAQGSCCSCLLAVEAKAVASSLGSLSRTRQRGGGPEKTEGSSRRGHGAVVLQRAGSEFAGNID